MDAQQAEVITNLHQALDKLESTRVTLMRMLEDAYAAPWEYLRDGIEILPDLYLYAGSHILRDYHNRIRAAVFQGGGYYWNVIMFNEEGKDTYSWEHDKEMGYDDGDLSYSSAKEKVMEMFAKDGVVL